MTISLTHRQADALRFIGAYVAKRGYAPTLTGLCVGLGMSAKSRGGMQGRLHRLRERGYLIDQPERMRKVIALSDAGRAFCKKFPSPNSWGPASGPSKPSAPARSLETLRTDLGQGAQAGTNSNGGAQ